MTNYIEIAISKQQYLLLQLEYQYGVTVVRDGIEDEEQERAAFFQRILGTTQDIHLNGEVLNLGNDNFVLRIPIE